MRTVKIACYDENVRNIYKKMVVEDEELTAVCNILIISFPKLGTLVVLGYIKFLCTLVGLVYIKTVEFSLFLHSCSIFAFVIS